MTRGRLLASQTGKTAWPSFRTPMLRLAAAGVPAADASPRRRWCSGRRAVDLERAALKKNLAAILFAAAALAAQLAWAEGSTADVTDMQALRAAIRTDKKAFVASTLQLTYAEAKKFWPLYDTYQRSLDAANQRRTLVAINLVSLGQAGV